MGRVHPALLASLVLLALVVFLFSDFLFGSRVLYERDLMTVWYPQAASFMRCWGAGSWPVWDPWVGFGQPLLAQPEAQVAYPFTWLRLLFEPSDYYLFFVVFHLTFSGVGLYLFLGRLGIGRIASAAGAAIWVASGPFISAVNLWHHFASVAWAPWVLLATLRLIDRPRADRMGGLAVAGGMQMLAGSAEMTGLTLCATAFLLAASWARRAHESSLARVCSLSLCAWLVAALIAAVAWLPTAMVARDSARWGGLSEENRIPWSVHPTQLAELLMPVAYDDLPLSNEARHYLFGLSVHPFLKSTYLGLSSLILVAAALFRSDPRDHWPWLAFGLGCLLVSLGPHTPVYGAFVALVPPLASFRYPSKAALGLALCWSVLSALGLDSVRRAAGQGQRSWRLVAAATAAIVVAIGLCGVALIVNAEFFASLEVVRERANGRLVNEIGFRVLLASLLAAVVLYCVARRAGATLAGQVTAAAVAVLELTLATRGLNRSAPRSLLAFRPPLVDRLQTQDRARVYTYDYGQSPGLKARRYLDRDFALVSVAGGLDPLMQELAAYEYLPPPLAGRWGIEGSYDMDLRGLQPRLLADLNGVLRAVEGSPLHLRLLRVGAVSRVVALHTANLEDLVPIEAVASLLPEPIRVFEVPNSQARTYAVGEAVLRTGPDEIRALLQPDFDPAREAVLSGVGPPTRTEPFTGTSTITSMKPDEVVIDAVLSRPGWVVLVDAYDPGWRATVDGGSAPLLRANAVFRAVAVPSGSHRIEMRYRPPAVAIGLLVSAGGFAIVLSLAAASAFGRRAAR